MTELPREIVSYTDNGTTGTGEIHFKVDGTLSSTSDTDFYIYYGNSSASDHADNATYGAENVWSNYASVFHMGESSGSTAEDSTGNGDGTYQNGLPDQSTGVIGDAQNYATGSDDRVEVTDRSDLSFGDGSGDSAFSVSMIHKLSDATTARLASKRVDSTAGNIEWMWSTNGSDFLQMVLYDNTNAHGIQIRADNAYTSDEGSWVYSTFTYDGSESQTGMTQYKNGSSESTTLSSFGTYTAMHDTSTLVTVGSVGLGAGSWDSYNGDIDEARIYPGELTSTWISTEYNNHSDPDTFWDVGTQEEPASGGGDDFVPTMIWFSFVPTAYAESVSPATGVPNGCGPGIFSYIIPDLIFREDCDQHDDDYETDMPREEADDIFHGNMIIRALQTGWPGFWMMLALVYATTVRKLGWFFRPKKSNIKKDGA